MDNEIVIDLNGIFYGHDKITYRDVPIAKCPFDYVIFQMIINEVKPDLIIEIGTSEGGSAVYMADLLDIIGKGIVHTIDIKEKIDSRLFNTHNRIKYFNQGYEQYDIKNADGYDKILVIDDATHAYGHVLGSLNKFKDLVSIGSYFIVEDGITQELIKKNIFNFDYWGGGPLKAIEEFLGLNDNFVIDRKWCDFFGKNAVFSVNGYLKKIK